MNERVIERNGRMAAPIEYGPERIASDDGGGERDGDRREIAAGAEGSTRDGCFADRAIHGVPGLGQG
jgi:hypothetical protein